MHAKSILGGPLGVAAAARPRGFKGSFRSRSFTGSMVVSGITKDASGVVLGGCVVKLFESATDTKVGTTTSDAVTGAYSFTLGNNSTAYYVVVYKAGAPDVMGTSVNTIFPTTTG